ncbi:MAG TPA: hypothetical protein PK435_15330, partial [Thermoanaerobaculaceae bacterium]|nr:hypothetical protein [Thermoanaerobaculaceae bacterium]
VRFPLGEMTKEEVRALARGLGLPNSGRRDSQEVCFVPEGGSYRDVLERLAPGRLPGAGEIVDLGGRVVGYHGGFHLFTVGQRRGLGVAGKDRLYVVEVTPSANRVVVGRAQDALHRHLRVRDVNWLTPTPADPMRLRFRSARDTSRSRPPSRLVPTARPGSISNSPCLRRLPARRRSSTMASACWEAGGSQELEAVKCRVDKRETGDGSGEKEGCGG